MTGTWAQTEVGKGGTNGRGVRRQTQAHGAGIQGPGETWVSFRG